MIIKGNKTVLFYGDSITDANKSGVEGPVSSNTLGTAYVGLINSMIINNYPNHRLRVINQGISGNTVLNLLNRFEDDVKPYKPNYIFILIGINDVRLRFHNEIYNTQLLYKEELEKLINKSLDITKDIILISPFLIELNNDDPIKKEVYQYVDEMKKLSEKYKLGFINIQEAFDNALKVLSPNHFTTDRVHLNLTGNMLVANTIYNFITK